MTDRSSEVARAAERVRWPALGLLVTAGVSLLVTLSAAAFSLALLATGVSGGLAGVSPPGTILFRLTWEAALVACNAVVIVGAIQMMRLRQPSLAMATCVIALVPCVGPCFVLGMPFGLWGLHVLNDPGVSGSFDRAES